MYKVVLMLNFVHRRRKYRNFSWIFDSISFWWKEKPSESLLKISVCSSWYMHVRWVGKVKKVRFWWMMKLWEFFNFLFHHSSTNKMFEYHPHKSSFFITIFYLPRAIVGEGNQKMLEALNNFVAWNYCIYSIDFIWIKKSILCECPFPS